MKVEFEIVKPTPGNSFRILHQKAPIKDFVWQYHYHPEFEIACVLSGTGTRHVGNHLSRYNNGDLVLIGANLPHSGFGLNASDPHEEIVLQVREEEFLATFQQQPEMESIINILEKAKYGIAYTGNVKKQVMTLMQEIITMQPFKRYLQLLEILQLLATAKKYELLNKEIILSADVNKNRARLQKIFTYVEQHFADEIDICNVAKIVALSVPSFCNYFKRTTQITFTNFVNQYRIQKACLLLQHDKTISEISFECGFNNVTYFNRVFKSILKKSPSAFIKERK